MALVAEGMSVDDNNNILRHMNPFAKSDRNGDFGDATCNIHAVESLIYG